MVQDEPGLLLDCPAAKSGCPQWRRKAHLWKLDWHADCEAGCLTRRMDREQGLFFGKQPGIPEFTTMMLEARACVCPG